jgi:hypothetical protein
MIVGACTTIRDNPQTQTAKNKIIISFTPVDAWVERDFYHSTDYVVEEENGNTILIANSSKSASLLYRKIKVDLNKTPYLNWNWKVNNTLEGNLQEKHRKGDDFPARIYIAIKPDLGGFKPRALTYVWASNVIRFDSWRNPYSKSVGMIALQSGKKHIKKWVSEKLNLRKDLSELFNMPIDSIEGIAVMTDTDNMKGYASAAYANLFFSAN